jgi:hypothetical protein
MSQASDNFVALAARCAVGKGLDLPVVGVAEAVTIIGGKVEIGIAVDDDHVTEGGQVEIPAAALAEVIFCPRPIHFQHGLRLSPAVDLAQFGNHQIGFVLHPGQADVLRAVAVRAQRDESIQALDVLTVAVLENPQFVAVRTSLSSAVCVGLRTADLTDVVRGSAYGNAQGIPVFAGEHPTQVRPHVDEGSRSHLNWPGPSSSGPGERRALAAAGMPAILTLRKASSLRIPASALNPCSSTNRVSLAIKAGLRRSRSTESVKPRSLGSQ